MLLGCGSEAPRAPSDACNPVAQCGGDVRGAWDLVDACYLSVERPMVDNCEAATSSAEVLEPSGGVSFDGERYTFDFMVTMRLTVHLPEHCLHQGDATFTCAELGGPLPRGATLVCAAPSGGGCDCTADLPITGDDVGPYSVRDEQLQLRAEPFDYCVQGDQLLLNHRIDLELRERLSMTTLLQLTLGKPSS